ncbi:MAG: 50S ribosomal protein L21 [Anaerolineae bacterium]|nr:50S ribosomal protein L21 [Anaerolineae bacterium]
MYAVVRTGGRQYRVEPGAEVDVERLAIEVGQSVELDEVLLVADGDSATVGTPLVSGAMVKATVVDQYRDRKILVWKYRPKQRYRRRKGHRQYYTRLRIDEIVTA